MLESFISSTPVLSCDVAGVAEQIVEPHHGWIIENSQDALNKAIVMLCENTDLLQQYKIKLLNYKSENSEILNRLEAIFHEN